MSSQEESRPILFPPQPQHGQPDHTQPTRPEPQEPAGGSDEDQQFSGEVVTVLGQDSRIRKSISSHLTKQGADILVVYINEYEDAKEVQRLIEQSGRRCELLSSDSE